MSNQDNADYKSNPLFSDEYSKMQGAAASPSLQYGWDSQSGCWVPSANEDKLDQLLKTLSGQLSGIHIEAKLDHDTVSHAYLSSISGSATGTLFSANKTSSLMESNTASAAESLTKQREANTWLSGISGELSDIEVHVSTDADTVAHEYLGSISGSATGSLHLINETHKLLEGNIGPKLESIKSTSLDMRGELEEIEDHSNSIKDHTNQSNVLAQKSNIWLSGISGELADIEVHVSTDADTKTHGLLESISGTNVLLAETAEHSDLVLSYDIKTLLTNIKSESVDANLKLAEIEQRNTSLEATIQSTTNKWLKGISGELADIEVHVATDADTKAHDLLESISGVLTGNLSASDETNTWLKGISGELADIEVHVATDADTKAHDLLESISGVLTGNLSASDETNTWLKGISGELADIEVGVTIDADTKAHELLENISGTLTGNLYASTQASTALKLVNDADVKSHGLLESISGTLTGQQSETNTWLKGISGELADIEVGVTIDADTKAHELLENISGTLTGNLYASTQASTALKLVNDADVKSHGLLESISGTLTGQQSETNTWLKGISGELADIEVGVTIDADIKSHSLLESISGTLTGQQSETNKWLKGISGELADIEVHVATDADTKAHDLLESISGTLTGQQSETNTWLKGISGELADIEVGVTVDSDETAHELLRSISGDSLLARKDLDKIIPILTGKLITSDARAQQALTNISGLAEVNNALSRLQFTKRTDTFTERVEADHILFEAPDSEVYGSNPAPEYGVNRDILDDLFNTQYKNGRDNPNTPEAGQFFMLDESAPDNRPKQRKYAFDTEAQYALKLDSFLGNQDGAQRLSDHGLDNIQNVTILNDSIYPIKIYSSETNYKSFYLYDGHSVSIDNTNASDIMVKRDHLISDFNVDYTITYLDPNAEINLERVVGAFDPPEPPPETRWTTWAPQAPLDPEPPVATENPEVQGWMASETPIIKNKEVTRTNTSALVKGKVYGAKPAMIIVVWGETEEGTSDHEEWDDFATLGQKSNEEFERLVTALDKDLTYYFRVKATNTDGEETWSEPIEKTGLIQIEDATNIEAYQATISGTIRDTGGDSPTVTAYWGTANGFGIIEGLDLWQNQRVIGVTDPGPFFLIANVPSKNTTYYFGFKTVNPDGTIRSSVKSFTTLNG